MTGVGVGLREDGVEARDRGVRDEALRAVEDVVVAVSPRGRPHRRGVGARPGLGQGVCGEPLARREPGQEALLLLLAARELDPERAELLHGEEEAARRAHLRDLLDDDQREQRPGPRAAEALLEEKAEEPVLPEELDDVPGKLVRRVDLGSTRRDPLARERTDELAHLELLVAQRLPGHGRSLVPRLAPTRVCDRPPRGCSRPGRERTRRSTSRGSEDACRGRRCPLPRPRVPLRGTRRRPPDPGR